jgi:hypothetical protein
MAIRFRLPALLRGQRPEPDLVEPRWRLLPWARWRHLAETLRSRRVGRPSWSTYRGRGAPLTWRTIKTTVAAVLAYQLARRLVSDPIPLLAALTAVLVAQITIFATVALAAHAKVKKLRREDLYRLVHDLEATGRQRVLDIGDYRDPFVARLAALGVESIYAVKAKPGSEGMVLVRAGTYFGRGWDGPTTDQWLGELLVSDRGRNKVGKLARATAAERHLVVVLDAFSQAGMGISLALTARHERGTVEYGSPRWCRRHR